jgi:hypothetical protein
VHGVRHPYNKALYEPAGPGRVEVTSRDGRVGFYAADGRWLEGENFDVDPQLCGWVCAPRAVHRMVNTASH